MFNPLLPLERLLDKIDAATNRGREQFLIGDVTGTPMGYNEEVRPLPKKVGGKQGIAIKPKQLFHLSSLQEEWLWNKLCAVFFDVQDRWVPRPDILIYGEHEHWRLYSEINLHAHTLFGDCDCWAMEIAYRLIYEGIPFRFLECKPPFNSFVAAEMKRSLPSNGNHLVIEVAGYILCMNQGSPRGNESLINYNYTKISGYTQNSVWCKVKPGKRYS